MPNRGRIATEAACGVLAVEDRAGGIFLGRSGQARRQGRGVDRRAQFHRARKPEGDEEGRAGAFFYHTGDEKQVVGIVEIIREAYKDPTDEKGVFYCVDTRAVKPFPKPSRSRP
jgi:hypothetical protein